MYHRAGTTTTTHFPLVFMRLTLFEGEVHKKQIQACHQNPLNSTRFSSVFQSTKTRKEKATYNKDDNFCIRVCYEIGNSMVRKSPYCHHILSLFVWECTSV